MNGRRLVLAVLGALLAALAAVGPARAATACSPYMGTVFLNELRVGNSNRSSTSNQVEIYNPKGIPSSEYASWTILVYRGTASSYTVNGPFLLSSNFASRGNFVYSTRKLRFRNKSGQFFDVALLDQSGKLIDYVSVEGRLQSTPACFTVPKSVDATSGSDTSGNIARSTDGGNWPSAVTNTTTHTIGYTNTCTASGADVGIDQAVDVASPIVKTTTVTYTLTVQNKTCATSISNITAALSGVTSLTFSGLKPSASQGSATTGLTGVAWNVGSLNPGAVATLTLTGVPIVVGPLASTATITGPTGRVNTADDSDTVSITVGVQNAIGFAAPAATLIEGDFTSFSAEIQSAVPPTKPVTVSYKVITTTDKGDTDLPASGTVTIDPTDSNSPDATTIDFKIHDDRITEPTKTITLVITGVSSADPAVQLDGTATTMTITLEDDDPAGPDHYELSLPSTAVSCLPVTATVTACADATVPCTNRYTAAVGQGVTLATSGGTLAPPAAVFDATGVATAALSWPTATQGATATVSLSATTMAPINGARCCPAGAACSAAASCSTVFSTAGLVIAASSGGAAATIPTQTAGSASGNWILRAIRTNTTTQACEAALVGASTVNWGLKCMNPSTCSSGNRTTLTGTVATLISANPLSGVPATLPVPMLFDAAGNAPFSFSYADVGQVQLVASKLLNGATLSGSSNAFVVKPAGFSLSSVRQTGGSGTVNPGATSATGGVFVKAGEAFSAVVTAVTSTGAAAPNFGRETVPEGVTLSATLLQPAGGVLGSLQNASVAGGSFTAGVATLTSLSYGEVGTISLTPSVASGSYLGAGNVVGTAVGPIGRFVPAHFVVSGSSLTHRASTGCSPASSFTYLGENLRVGFTVTAQNAAGATTTNYSGSWAKLNPAAASAWQAVLRDGATVFTTANGRLSVGSASGSFTNGIAAVTLTLAGLRGSAPDGPFVAGIGVAPVDSDGVALDSFDLASAAGGAHDRASVGTAALRFGRLRLANAAGAADRPLVLPATLQYWNGSGWVTNTLDSCTTVPVAAANVGNLRRGLTTADAGAAAGLSVVAGVGGLRLAAPAGGRRGTLDVSLSLGGNVTDASCLQPWTPRSADAGLARPGLGFLRGAWCGSIWAQDPAARATFGIQRTQHHLIDRRENF